MMVRTEVVDMIEQRTGLDLFWELPDAREDALEAADNASWALTWVKLIERLRMAD